MVRNDKEYLPRTWRQVLNAFAAKSWGTVYFCISVVALFMIICANTYNNGQKWILPQYVYLTGIMAMTLGDAFAAIVGETFGRRKHYVSIDPERVQKAKPMRDRLRALWRYSSAY